MARRNAENPSDSKNQLSTVKKLVLGTTALGMSVGSILGLTGCGDKVSAEPKPEQTPTATAPQTPGATESATPVTPITSESPVDKPTTAPSPSETESEGPSVELEPLREWTIDSSLFEGWDLLSEDEKEQKAHTFFLANITDERYTPRFDAKIVGRLDMEQTTLSTFAELSAISDLYMDGTLGELGKTAATSLLDVIATEDTKDVIISKLDSEWQFFSNYDDCGGCTFGADVKRYNHINKVLLHSPEIVYSPNEDIYRFTTVAGLYFDAEDKWYDSSYGVAGANIDINKRQITAIGWGEDVTARFTPNGEVEPIGYIQEVIDYLADAPYRSK